MSVVTGISGINLSAASAAYAPTNSADVSAIASAYAESAVSATSGNYYSTSNPSSFITGVDLSPYATTAYVDSSVSSKADSSALTSYALSSDVSGTVDLVSTQSANWGGSALALSAGPGVELTKSGNTLIASVSGPVYGDETIAGYHNGQVVYQTLVSGIFSSHEGKTAITSNALYSASPLAWFDVSQSYILYGNTGNILPLSWQLGTGRNGSISLLGGTRQCVYRGQDSAPTQCSAFITVKYVKA